ncbi:hypothetical protein EFP49_07885 [Lactobacillus johnsonii]|uniref:YfhO family protein n=1 Tax=Lactobacillus johnsonii TaxID=33959 RepID=UPI0021A5D901|nr:YfhO family protein [Lactobacillus johnsonii]MCT3342702.1 hypothetical protein [Lactobacillus johnsonii]
MFSKNKIKYQSLLIGVFLLFCAFIATYPSFLNSYFKITMDGQIHFIRFEEIAQAFKAGHFPPLVNFMGFGHWGNAFTGMYPWISGLFFIIPRIVFTNPIHAIMIGYFLVNLFTLINAYFLSRELTKKYYWQLLGTLLYEFNTYHLCVLYGRDALGEALAYTFLPLVFLGCIQIWNNKKVGILTLALGMGMTANSHVITMAFTCLFIVIIEIFRIFGRKITLKEVVRFIYAALITGLIACFSLLNMLTLMQSNELLTPGKGLSQVIPSEMFDAMLNNSISDNFSRSWNIGIIAFIMLLFLTFQLFTKKEGTWKYWTLGAWAVLISTFSWIPYSNFVVNSFFGNIQFLGRLNSFVVVFLVIATVLYFDKYGAKLSEKTTFYVISALMMLTCIFGCATYQTQLNDNPIRYYITKGNYYSTINDATNAQHDYMITKNNKEVISQKVLDETPKSLKTVDSNFNSLILSFNEKNGQKVTLPFMLYNGINYQVKVNGENIRNFNSGQVLSIKSRTGRNIVKVTSSPSALNIFTFVISMISITIVSILLIMNIVKNKKN